MSKNKDRKLVKVTFDFDDGLITWIDGEDALIWQNYVNEGLKNAIIKGVILEPPKFKVQSNKIDQTGN